MYGQQTGGNTLVYLYDANGSVYDFTYNGAPYYYHRNIQGDVLGIYDSTGTELVTYSYDAWGLPTGMTDTSTNGIGTINPIRYRGYLYDAELGFYWLTTRFYDPEIGRFINADGYVSTGQGMLGYNMYAYCGNDPVNRADPSGMWWEDVENFFKEWWEKVTYHHETTQRVNQQITAEQNRIVQEVASGAWEAYNRSVQQITAEQNRIVQEVVSAVWEAYNRGVQMQNEAQMLEAQMINDALTGITHDPEKQRIIGKGGGLMLDAGEILSDGLSGNYATAAVKAVIWVYNLYQWAKEVAGET